MSLFKSILSKEQQEMLKGDAQIPGLDRDSISKERRAKLEFHEKLLSLGFIELKEWGTGKKGDAVTVGKMAGLTQAGVDYRILGDFWYRVYRYSQLFSLPLAVIAVVISFVSLLLTILYL